MKCNGKSEIPLPELGEFEENDWLDGTTEKDRLDVASIFV